MPVSHGSCSTDQKGVTETKEPDDCKAVAAYSCQAGTSRLQLNSFIACTLSNGGKAESLTTSQNPGGDENPSPVSLPDR